MNDHTDPVSTLEHPAADTPERPPSGIFLPAGIYEALPAAYVSIGTLLILGAAYIGIGHGPTIGYSAVGLSCIFAGLSVNSIRRKERSRRDSVMA